MKKFFQKLRMDVKFAKAGEGHKLTEDTRTYKPVESTSQPHVRTRPMSSSQIQAGAAAVARHDERNKQNKTVVPKVIRTKSSSLAETSGESSSQETKEKTVTPAIESTVMFHSPFTDEIILKSNLKSHMRENLILNLSENPLEASSLMIQTLTTNKEKKEAAVSTLNKYLDNIISHPKEEKYAKIRKNNRIFSERVAPVEGCEEFLEGLGFKKKLLEEDEIYFVLEKVDVTKIEEAKEILASAEAMEFRIYRDPKILIAKSGEPVNINLSKDFYKLTPSEIKQEQDRRTEQVELNQQLRTKAMREAGNVSYKSNYSVIRIKFPDNRLLQGTFRASETVEDLKTFISTHINVEWAVYYLKTPLGESIENDESTLLSLKLVPTGNLYLSWNEEIRLEILKEQGIHLALCA